MLWRKAKGPPLKLFHCSPGLRNPMVDFAGSFLPSTKKKGGEMAIEF